MPVAPFFPFERSEVGGVVTVNVFAALATLALLSILGRITWLAISHFMHRADAESREYTFFHTQLGYYSACLLIANAIGAVAGLMGFPPLIKGGLSEDNLCRTQAAIMQFANVAAAYFTVAMAVHTFNSLVLRNRQAKVVSSIFITVGWAVAAVIAIVPIYMKRPSGPIYGISDLSCGVRPVYPKQQFLMHLLPIFIAAFFSALFYSFIFLVLRGTLVIKGGIKLQMNPNERWSMHDGTGYHYFIVGIARGMLWFPIAYIVFLVPYSVTRLLAMSGFQVPFEAMVFAYVCWFMLGIANVLLLYNVFRIVRPVLDNTAATSKGRDLESFATKSLSASSAFMSEKDGHAASRPSFTSNISTQGLLPQVPESAALASFYSYPTSSTIYQNVSSVPSSFNRPIVSNSPSRLPRSPDYHSRGASADSMKGLPAPPRRDQSPQLSPNSRQAPVNGRGQGSSQTNVDPVRRPDWVHAPHPSVSSADQDTAGWRAPQNQDGSISRGRLNQPLTSPSFSSTDSISSPSRLKPLMLASSPSHPRAI